MGRRNFTITMFNSGMKAGDTLINKRVKSVIKNDDGKTFRALVIGIVSSLMCTGICIFAWYMTKQQKEFETRMREILGNQENRFETYRQTHRQLHDYRQNDEGETRRQDTMPINESQKEQPKNEGNKLGFITKQ